MTITLIMLFITILLECSCAIAQDECNSTDKRSGSEDNSAYSFEYFAGKVDRQCKIYRLKNKLGSPSTPVLWKAPEEVFFDAVLAKCTSQPCKPLEKSEPSSADYYLGKTQLGWGTNHDEFNDTPEVYLEKPVEHKVADRNLSPLVVTIRGPVAGPDRSTVELGLRVASLALRTEGGYELTYEVTNLVTEEIMNFALPGEPPGNGLRVVWESAFSQEFGEYVKSHELRTLYPGQKLDIRVHANDIEIKTDLLTIYQGTTSILSTTAGAYIPHER